MKHKILSIFDTRPEAIKMTPSLGKPVLVMRERPEAVDAETVKIVGTDPKIICREVNSLLEDNEKHMTMSQAHNPYGDGNASDKMINYIVGGWRG